MRKLLCVVSASLIIGGSTGCVNTSKYNPSQDDQWIQTQVEQGKTVPDKLK